MGEASVDVIAMICCSVSLTCHCKSSTRIFFSDRVERGVETRNVAKARLGHCCRLLSISVERPHCALDLLKQVILVLQGKIPLSRAPNNRVTTDVRQPFARPVYAAAVIGLLAATDFVGLAAKSHQTRFFSFPTRHASIAKHTSTPQQHHGRRCPFPPQPD